jgi:hypothetical protein
VGTTRAFPLESPAFDRVFCCLVLDHLAEMGEFLRVGWPMLLLLKLVPRD